MSKTPDSLRNGCGVLLGTLGVAVVAGGMFLAGFLAGRESTGLIDEYRLEAEGKKHIVVGVMKPGHLEALHGSWLFGELNGKEYFVGLRSKEEVEALMQEMERSVPKVTGLPKQ
jgi:hypothetical protein